MTKVPYTEREDKIILDCYSRGIGAKSIAYSYLRNRSPASISMRAARIEAKKRYKPNSVRTAINIAVTWEDKKMVETLARSRGETISSFARKIILEECRCLK